jgi:D-alanyl-lipoteichoic acid acyltransferase DltB (MBOAT superfamily)
MITMTLGGLWHGANWNCVLWGVVNGLLLVIHRIFLWIIGKDGASDTTRPVLRILLTFINFHVFCATLVFFRAEGLGDIFVIFERMFLWSPGLMVPWLFPAVLMPFLVMADLLQSRMSVSDYLLRSPRLSRIVIYLAGALMLALILSSKPVDFIYFVF